MGGCDGNGALRQKEQPQKTKGLGRVAELTMKYDAEGLISGTDKGTATGKRADLLKRMAEQNEGARQRGPMQPTRTRRASAASSLGSDCSMDIDSRLPHGMVPRVSPVKGLFGRVKDEQGSGMHHMLPRLATSRKKMQRWKPLRQRPCTPFEGTAVCGIAGADVFRHAVVEVPEPASISRAQPSSVEAEARVTTVWPMPRRLGPADGQRLGNLVRTSSVSRAKQHPRVRALPQLSPWEPAQFKARSPLSLSAFPRSRFGELRRLQSSSSLVASVSQQTSSKTPRDAAAWDGSKSTLAQERR